MKELCKILKDLVLHPTFHTLAVALTAMYLIFGVLNAGFIMVQVAASIIDYIWSHLPANWNVIHVWYRGIIFS